MGQVISFPTQREERTGIVTPERRAAFITGLSALTFLLGFFIAGPVLALFAFGYATTAHPGSAITCVAGLLVVWALTRAAYKRL
ncbi:MAG TPA: hypothetical protein VFZ00_09560 [Solirubrobacter sp.]|nr:hypothetical protein [Solirubrobacter sp.]